MTFQQMTVKTIRDGRTRVDWEKRELIVRKPRPLPRDKDPNELGCTVIQAKCDGIHLVIALDPNDNHPRLRALTMQGHDVIEQYPANFHVTWFFQVLTSGLMNAERNYVDAPFVEGELHVPGKGREAVKTALKEAPDTLRFAVFGTNMVNPGMPLDVLRAWCKIGGLESLDFLPVGALSSTIEWSASVLGLSCDGVVYKDTMYGQWYKEKNQRTIDCVVMGMKPGIGKYWGQCGALTVGVHEPNYEAKLFDRIPITGAATIAVAHVSGMDDAIRSQMTSDDIGRVCEIKYERVGSKGRLQHPRFVAWRDDKQPEDCTLDQDEDLVAYYTQQKG